MKHRDGEKRGRGDGEQGRLGDAGTRSDEASSHPVSPSPGLPVSSSLDASVGGGANLELLAAIEPKLFAACSEHTGRAH